MCFEGDRATCSDGRDNDGDGDIDCADSSCSREPTCSDACEGSKRAPRTPWRAARTAATTTATATPTATTAAVRSARPRRGPGLHARPWPGEHPRAANDGADNDDNGFVDCNDFGCTRSQDQAILDYCAERMENTLERCGDGVDNDDNGYVDCNDFSCSRSDDPAILALCAASAEDTVERCSDGEDNDGNGFIDCNDFSCSQSDNPDVLALCGTPEGGGIDPEAARASCSDGIDNDGNGYVDCADYNAATRGCVRTTSLQNVYRPDSWGSQEAPRS